jgi:glycosyltransferase involved in cell wall biosynthesis
MSDRILVFIPAYRCEQQIGRVLQQFAAPGPAERFAEILVLDNRSPDGTVAAAQEAGRRIGLENLVIGRNRDNYGLGGSHKAAFRHAVEEGFTHVVVLHGDDQADIADLMPVLETGAHEENDCCLGARFHWSSKLSGYSRTRTLGNVAFNVLFSAGARKILYDLGSGLNIYRTEMLKDRFYTRFPDNLMFNYCMILASSVKRHRISFFPISWREEDQVSNVKLFSQAMRTLGILRTFVTGRKNFLSKEFRDTVREDYSFDVVYRG